MPFSLFTKFSLQLGYKSIENRYANGEYQTSSLVGSSRRSWNLAKRLGAAEFMALGAFYTAQNGRQIPFYIYDVTIPGVVWDDDGSATLGRYVVRFDSPWSDTVGIGRGDCTFSIIEVTKEFS